jgi:imidazolonepropionase-like amidohydrolase/Tol biopolymer transport system component
MTSRARALFVLASILLLVPPAAAAEAADAGEARAEWSVSDPPGTWRTIAIDTTETTWSSVTVSPDGRTIVFDMLGDLFRVPIEGGEAEALTSGIAWDFQPRFAPDGRRIAFVSDRGGGDNLWVMNADGSDPRPVSEEDEHLVHNPYWSPDGAYIVAKKGFTSTRSIPAGEIWLFHAGGGGGLQVTERPHGERDQKTMADPAFSADGRYIYYSQDVTPGREWQYNKDSTGEIFAVKRLDRETGEIETYVGGPGGAVAPTPSPDGRALAFVRRTPGLQSALWVKDLESGIERPVYERFERDLQETDGSQGNAPFVAWTPDARELVFWSGGQLRRVDVATKQARVIPVRVRVEHRVQPALRVPVDVAPERFPVRMLRWAQFSPDGERVVYQALGRLWTRELPNGEPRRLTRQEEHFELYPSFSRDGGSIVYVTWDDQELGSVRVIPAEGGEARVVTPQPGHYVEPRFAPDGGALVYRKIAGGYLLSPRWSQDPGLYLLDLERGEPRRISRSGRNAHFGAAADRIYFTERDGDRHLLLKSVDRAGREERVHLKGSMLTEYSISPDGRWVAFTEQYDAYVAPFARTGKTVEIGPDSKAIPVRRVSRRSGEGLHWSSDAGKLHWAHGATLYTRALTDAFAFLEGAPAELPEPVTEGLDLGFTAPFDRPEGMIALVGGRVITMRDANERREVIEDGVVLVERNRIVAVGPRDEVAVPEDAFLLDVSGKTVVPGLVDVHAHGAMARNEITPEQNWMQFSNLSFGVTTIHDPSNDTSSIFAAAELQKAGEMLAPRIFSTGTILYGAHAPGYRAEVESYEDALFHVRRLRDVGAISVKSYQHPRRDQRQMVVAAGHELGVMVVPEGGAKFQHNMNEIVDGHTGIEHAIPLARGYDDVVQLWSQTEVGYTPTFVVAYGGLSGEEYWYDRTEVWKNERLMRYVPRFVVEPRSIRRQTAPDSHYNHFEVARFAKELRDEGVSVQIGAHGQREGLAAHWELWMMHQGGFTPWEALRGATIDGAWYVGLDHELGSIEPGKLADLFVVDGNPLEDLRRSEYVAYTMINGRLYDVATMSQIGNETSERQPFFFEQEGGDTLPPSTTEWLARWHAAFGCND